jgi:hypothetical protein
VGIFDLASAVPSKFEMLSVLARTDYIRSCPDSGVEDAYCPLETRDIRSTHTRLGHRMLVLGSY